MSICIIPARGGSKRIPRKNIKPFCGTPMLVRAINLARASGCFGQIVVSTDDDAVAELARQAGAEVVMRPAALADDFATTVAVIRHAINALGLPLATAVCCLYPCTPLLKPQLLATAFEDWQASGLTYAMPVLAFESSIWRALQCDGAGQLTTVFDKHNEQMRTQDFATTYHDAGQFYWGRASSWLSEASIHNHALGVVLPKHSVVDIDDDADWQLAEMLYQIRHDRGDDADCN